MLKPDRLADGIPSRVWEGETERGIKVHAFISRIAVDKNEDTEQFDRELLECEAPTAEIEAIPNRLII
jgi:hypothetical protein